jgi:hypothetical protein
VVTHMGATTPVIDARNLTNRFGKVEGSGLTKTQGRFTGVEGC